MTAFQLPEPEDLDPFRRTLDRLSRRLTPFGVYEIRILKRRVKREETGLPIRLLGRPWVHRSPRLRIKLMQVKLEITDGSEVADSMTFMFTSALSVEENLRDLAGALGFDTTDPTAQIERST